MDSVRQNVSGHIETLRKGAANSSQAALLGSQLGLSLTQMTDPATLQLQAPPGVTLAMMERNLGLQRGMAEFRYGPHRPALAERLSAVDAAKVQRVVQQYLSMSRGSVYTIGPRTRRPDDYSQVR